MFVLLADMNITYLPCGNILLFYSLPISRWETEQSGLRPII